MPSPVLKLCFRLLRALSFLLPPGMSREWREEWETELCCQHLTLRKRKPHQPTLRLILRTLGAIPDAFWLFIQEWRLEMIVQDLRYAVRLIMRKPALAFIATLTLAVGIGASTAIFSFVNGIILRPLPYPQSDRLVEVWEKNPERNWYGVTAAPANFLDWRERARSFDGMEAYSPFPIRVTLTGEGQPTILDGTKITAGLFKVLSVQPMLGRSFRPEENWSDSSPTVVVSYNFWQRRFGGDPQILGRVLRLNGRSFQVIGVMPAGFSYPSPGIAAWTTYHWDRQNKTAVWFRRAHFLSVVGRLKQGTSYRQAEKELASIAADLSREYPETNKLMGNGLTPLHEWIVGDTERPLLVLFCAVGFLLLIACANVASLMLASSLVRGREIAVRSALGAGRLRLVRQLLTENLVLSLLGGSAGVLLAHWGLKVLLAMSPEDLPRLGGVSLDGRVLLFAVLLTLATTVLFGMAPALNGSRVPAGEALASGRTGTAGLRKGRARSFLVVCEVALSVVLVVGAGLLIRSFINLYNVDPGFRSQNILTFSVALTGREYSKRDVVIGFWRQLFERLRGQAGVESVSAVNTLPLTGHSWTSDFFIKGRQPGQYGIEVVHREVAPDYFRTMGVPLLRGRTFRDSDDSSAPRAVVINKALADQYFGDEDPIGQELCFDREPTEKSVWRTIIGVVGSEHQEGLAERPRIEIFETLWQNWQNEMKILIKSSGTDPRALLGMARQQVHALDPNIPLDSIRTMSAVVSKSLVRQRFLTLVLGIFAGVAMLLAAIGTYGVLAYSVNQRRREIGIRMALGAQRGDILQMILRQGMILVGGGLLVGLAAASVLTRYLSSLLFNVAALDSRTFASVVLVLVLVGIGATFLPARRASGMDPMKSLRTE